MPDRNASSVGGFCGNNVLLAEALGMGFQSCEHDCWGACATDMMIAIHAGYFAVRLWWYARGSPECRGLGWWGAWYATMNCIWSCIGTTFWLQPGGRPLPAIISRLGTLCAGSRGVCAHVSIYRRHYPESVRFLGY